MHAKRWRSMFGFVTQMFSQKKMQRIWELNYITYFFNCNCVDTRWQQLTAGTRRSLQGDAQVVPTLHVDTFPKHPPYPLFTVRSQVLKAVTVNIVVFQIRSLVFLWMSPKVSKDLLQARSLKLWSWRQHCIPRRWYSISPPIRT